MARYTLLTDDERHRLFDISTGQAALIRHYTLPRTRALEFVLARRGDRNRIGVAVPTLPAAPSWLRPARPGADPGGDAALCRDAGSPSR